MGKLKHYYLFFFLLFGLLFEVNAQSSNDLINQTCGETAVEFYRNRISKNVY